MNNKKIPSIASSFLIYSLACSCTTATTPIRRVSFFALLPFLIITTILPPHPPPTLSLYNISPRRHCCACCASITSVPFRSLPLLANFAFPSSPPPPYPIFSSFNIKTNQQRNSRMELLPRCRIFEKIKQNYRTYLLETRAMMSLPGKTTKPCSSWMTTRRSVTETSQRTFRCI